MSQKKNRETRQKVRKETGMDKHQKVSYSKIKHLVKEVLKSGEKPRYCNTHICEGLRGAYRRAKKGA